MFNILISLLSILEIYFLYVNAKIAYVSKFEISFPNEVACSQPTKHVQSAIINLSYENNKFNYNSTESTNTTISNKEEIPSCRLDLEFPMYVSIWPTLT